MDFEPTLEEVDDPGFILDYKNHLGHESIVAREHKMRVRRLKAFSPAAEGSLSLQRNIALMQTAERAGGRVGEPVTPAPAVTRRRVALFGGGTDGNERLTSMAGAILIVLLAVLGVTILRIGQLIWLHLFVGLVLLGPLLVKVASTGYRFARYYARSPAYRAKGPPEQLMRLIAPIVVASTVVVFVSGILLLIVGPRGREPYLLVHKASFVVWLGVTGVHVLGRLPIMARALRPAGLGGDSSGSAPGAAGRWITLVGALVCGLVLAVVLIPQFAAWTAPTALQHHDR